MIISHIIQVDNRVYDYWSHNSSRFKQIRRGGYNLKRGFPVFSWDWIYTRFENTGTYVPENTV